MAKHVLTNKAVSDLSSIWVFCFIAKNKIEIIRILHEQMDLKQQLNG